MHSLIRTALLAAFVGLATARLASAPAAPADRRLPARPLGVTGTVTGTVSNTATGNLLEGARVELPALGLATYTDNTGRFVLAGVPPGDHEVTASYLGLDAARAQVPVTAGRRTAHDFELTSGIYRLDAFKVVGEREGDALAITAQRNADHVKNIVAMDSFGNLPNMSAGEVIARLPGIAGNLSEEGLAYDFNVRGIDPALNTVTVDGGLLATNGTSRTAELQSITGTMFEQLELIKGHTPDTGADSLGGTINMKTRSPLNLREKRRLAYSATTRIAPAFTEQVPLREAHRAHPLLTLSYQEVFGILGGERNLGVAVNLFYSENAVGGYRVTYNHQNALASPAYVWSYQTRENFNNRKQSSVNVKTDYRYSFNTKFSLNLTLNNNLERFRRSFNTRAYVGSATAVPNATTSGVIPGYTDKITQVRPVSGARLDIVTNGPNAFLVETYLVDFAGEHEFGPLQLDYKAGLSRNDHETGLLPQGGQQSLTNRLSQVGWILDLTDSDLYPRLIQTAGADMTDPANYRPIANGLTKSNTKYRQDIPQVRANARYALPTAIPTFFKAGVAWREQSVEARNWSRRWSYLGATALPADPSARPFASLKTDLNLPRWQVSDFMDGQQPANPALWQEDLYYHEQVKYTGARQAREAVTAGYVMAQGKLGREGWRGRTGYLAGVRRERTETEGAGWVRARFASTTAQQTADPVGSAQRDYANTRRESEGGYTKDFPSVHFTHDFTPRLRTRFSWSTSFGRPAFSNLMPNESVNETNQTITINNPSLLPQTAQNWDVTLDYYFEPVGNLSVGWFRKSIRDYIVTGVDSGVVPGGSDNGYDGEYEGFTRLTSANAGTAVVQGWEFSYQQQFTFLPGLLRGLSGSANYTYIDTYGDFGGTASQRSGDVAGFIPRAANVSFSWRYRGFSTRVLYNFTGAHLSSYSSTGPALNLYRRERNTVNLGLAYQVRPALSFTCDIANLFNEPQRLYSGVAGRTQDIMINFVTVTLGVSGRF